MRRKGNRIALLRPTPVTHRRRRASDRHSNDRPEADISSMRQQFTEAPRKRFQLIDSLWILCRDKRH